METAMQVSQGDKRSIGDVTPPAFDVAMVCQRLRDGDLELRSNREGRKPHESLQRSVVLLSDDTLVVADAAFGSPLLMDYQATLSRAGVPYRQVAVELSDIAVLLEAAASQGRGKGAGKGLDVQEIAERQMQVVDIIQRAQEKKASDIHFVRKGDREGDICQIYARIDGERRKLQQVSGADGKALMRSIYQTMSDAHQDNSYQPRKPQDARLNAEFVRQLGLFGARISTRPRAPGSMMVLRLLYDTLSVEGGLAGLGYLPDQIETIRRFTHLSHGVIVISGPTGSGKSMTMKEALQEMLQYFDNKIHLLTIEDPCEYHIKGAEQTPLSEHGEWEKDIRSGVRMDPDVMMIGEIRDLPSARAAFRFAMTGHGVWTTVHANDSASVIDRLSDLGVDSTLLMDPSLMRGVIAQNLVQRLCPHCCQSIHDAETPIYADLRERLEAYTQIENVRFRNPRGCRKCDGHGIQGRLPVAEILVPDHQFFETFRKEGKLAARRMWLTALGGTSKVQHLAHLINQGVVDPINGEKSVALLDDDERTLGIRVIAHERSVA